MKVFTGKMVDIKAGSFLMGFDYVYDPKDKIQRFYPEEQPVHKVTLSAFQMSSMLITQAQYKAITGENPSTFKGDDLPVTNLGATDALKFCNKLSIAEGLEPAFDEKPGNYVSGKCDFSKNGYRLPTEAEWEYACRAGSKTHFNTGNLESDLDKAAWYIKNSGGKTHPVGQKAPNAWGLYDMHGNVWEQCYDGMPQDTGGFEYTPEDQKDPAWDKYFDLRVMRGGGWFTEAWDCRSSVRSSFWTGGGNYYIGFRIVRRPV